jgi:hypothetical protein
MTDYQKQFVSEDDLTSLRLVEERLQELLGLEEATKNITDSLVNGTDSSDTADAGETVEGEETVS